MRLTKHNLAHYLVDKGFMNPEYLVNGQFKFSQRQSRNNIFQIYLENHPSGLFVKQLLSLDPVNGYLMQKDATLHYLVQETELFTELRQYIPRYFGYEPKNHVFVTEFFSNAISVHEEILLKKELNSGVFEEMARILATFHKDLGDLTETFPSLAFFNRQTPWIMQYGDPDNPQIKNSGQATGSVAQAILQQPALVEFLEELRYEWHGNYLVHGDVKLINFIQADATHSNGLKLIDWEIADLGDPLWDLAGLMQSVITLWVFSQNPNPMLQDQPQSGMEFLSWDTVQSTCKHVWKHYIEVRQSLVPDTSLNTSAAREKVVKFTAARMLQTACEANMQATDIQPPSNRVLQIASQIIKSPEAWTRDLLGGQDDKL